MNFVNILLTILAAVVTFGLIIFVHEFGHFFTAKLSGVKVNEFALGMGPTILKKKKGDTTYALRAIPIGGFCAMEGEDEDSDSEGAFGKAPLFNRILIIIAGAVMNILLGLIIIAILISTDSAITSKKVSSFYENAQTQQSGLMVGDEFYSINGRRLFVADDIIYEMYRAKDGIADVTVIRDGEKITLEDFAFGTYVDEASGSNMITIDFTVYPIEKTLGNVVKETFRETGSTIRLIFVSVIDLITGNTALNELSGPVGIITVISEATTYGIRSLLNLMSFITINLGVFNLLPLPALDGGRLVFLVIEGVIGKKINPKFEAVVHVVGFALLLILMLFVTYNDVTRLFK